MPSLILPGLLEWRPVAGFPNYLVSSDGQVQSYARSRSRPSLLKGWLTKDGYRQYDLRHGSRRWKPYAHQLVALTFVGLPPSSISDPVVDHLDFDRMNNEQSNLRWYERVLNMRRIPATAHLLP
jgi:hypothetical protein